MLIKILDNKNPRRKYTVIQGRKPRKIKRHHRTEYTSFEREPKTQGYIDAQWNEINK